MPLTKAQHEAVLEVYSTINSMPRAGGGTQTANLRSLGTVNRYVERVRDHVQILLDAVMHGDAAEQRERAADLRRARDEVLTAGEVTDI